MFQDYYFFNADVPTTQTKAEVRVTKEEKRERLVDRKSQPNNTLKKWRLHIAIKVFQVFSGKSKYNLFSVWVFFGNQGLYRAKQCWDLII